uniref:Uncharacterized protein n=1 Tax=Solanum tuberosum TaxID=4113 RepID=M1A3B3_SOLTU
MILQFASIRKVLDSISKQRRRCRSSKDFLAELSVVESFLRITKLSPMPCIHNHGEDLRRDSFSIQVDCRPKTVRKYPYDGLEHEANESGLKQAK